MLNNKGSANLVNDVSSLSYAAKGADRQSLKTILPYGMLVTRKWLLAQGLSAHALDNAVKTETLLPLATGVYSQYSRSLSWEGVVASMQHMENGFADGAPLVLVGGSSALTLSGLAHYLLLGKTPLIHLYSQGKLPPWLARLSKGTVQIDCGLSGCQKIRRFSRIMNGRLDCHRSTFHVQRKQCLSC